jgi:hypothetical protein
LRPWRFFVVRPEQYDVFFDRLAAAATRVQGDASRYEMNRDKYRLTARAPLLIVAAARIDPTARTAPIEQAFAAAGQDGRTTERFEILTLSGWKR